MDPIKLLRPARVALITLLALSLSLCPAQEKSTGQAAASASADPYSITIDFPGGPLSKLEAGIAARKEVKFTIIRESQSLDPVLPAFSVRNERIDNVMAALGRILEPKGYALGPIGPGVAVLTQIERIKAPAFASLPIEAKLGDQSIEEFIAAIQAACEFANPDQKASTLRFKYHPGTKLLFVAGAPQEVDVAHRVFGSLPDAPAKAPTPPPEKK